MKLINYNRNNSIERPKEARPLLTICLVGHIYMNPAALKMFGLENYPENYGVEFFKDPENDQWYITRSAKPSAFKLSGKSGLLWFKKLNNIYASKNIRKLIVSSFKVEHGGYELHPLIPVKPDEL